MVFTYWYSINITASGQPILRKNEKDIYVEYSVGLYQNKTKIVTKQKGRCYLTSQRIIYIDDYKPTEESVALELNDILSTNYSSRFLKKSAKLVVFLKERNEDITLNTTNINNDILITVWNCPICMVINETNNQLMDVIPPCINCGVSADFEMIKGSITTKQINILETNNKKKCPNCIFVNDFSSNRCERCGTLFVNEAFVRHSSRMTTSMEKLSLNPNPRSKSNERHFIQFSFRNSDGILFSQATEKMLQDLEREKSMHLFNKGAIYVNGVDKNIIDPDLILVNNKIEQAGIATLERNREREILRNDIILNNALTDLNKLMVLANDIAGLYQKGFNSESPSTNQLLIIDRDKFLDKSMFLNEIAREIYQFVILQFKKQVEDGNGILISMVDLYALYNKSLRITTGFISPQEMKDACGRFENLGLHQLKLIKLNNRVLCLSSEQSFNIFKKKIIDLIDITSGANLIELTRSLHEKTLNTWTIGIITEALQYCIDEGVLVIDEQITGIRYYLNNYWVL